MNVFGKLKKYKPKQVEYPDGTLSPYWWKIKIYVDGKLWDETSTQYHEKEAKQIARKANFYAFLQYLEDLAFSRIWCIVNYLSR